MLWEWEFSVMSWLDTWKHGTSPKRERTIFQAWWFSWIYFCSELGDMLWSSVFLESMIGFRDVCRHHKTWGIIVHWYAGLSEKKQLQTDRELLSKAHCTFDHHICILLALPQRQIKQGLQKKWRSKKCQDISSFLGRSPLQERKSRFNEYNW